MINAQLLDSVKQKLVAAYQPEAIYLFGSYAWGTPNDDSDLDLLIIVDKSEEKPYKRAVSGIRSLRGLRIGKDIIVYTRSEFDDLTKDISTLCYKVKREGIKLYESV